MIKLLIGGSPCTYWSIAQKNNRETEASGMGWELFKNYLIAKEKFQPDFFLYENNKSAAQPIKDQIKKELDVYDGTVFSTDSGARYIEINSALVSAQNRQRFYVHNCGDVQQPEDRGILLKDIREAGGVSWLNKSRCLDANYFKATDGTVPMQGSQSSDRMMVAEPVGVGWRGRMENGKWVKQYEAREDAKANAITTATTDSMIAEPKRVPEYGNEDKSRPIRASYAYKGDGESSLSTEAFPENPSKQKSDYVAEPIRIGDLPNGRGEISGSQATRIYSTEGKSVNLVANGGGQGAKTGLYAISCVGSKEYPVYEVKDGKITIKGKQYPIKLRDGYYIIRKLTVTECCRLQTMPDDYCRAVSNSQAYKGLGNGWTAEVIIHILNGALKDVPRDEEIVVLSMYDGIGTGRYCLDKMGFTNIKYYAYEIDKYAMQIATSNFPDIIECGDAYQLREDNWKLR